MRSFDAFCAGLEIVSRNGTLGPFVLNAWQAKFCTDMIGRDVVWKDRMVGDTTLQLARDLWYATEVGGAVTVVVNDDPCGTMRRHAMRVLAIMAEGTAVRGTEYGFATDRGWINVFRAREAPGRLRSATVSRLHIDEAAFCAAGTIEALLPLVAKGGEFAVCSTQDPEHRGDSAAFSRLWTAAHLSGGPTVRAHMLMSPRAPGAKR